jgi:hypothetical protein
VAIYLGTATPSDYKLGSNAVSTIYLGTTQVWPVSSAALLTITRDNGSGVTSSFSGSGTTAFPFVRASGFYLDDANGLSHYRWTAGASGTVYVTFSYSDDTDTGQGAIINKNGSPVASSLTGATAYAVSVVSGNYVTISASGDASQQWFTNVSIYAT